MLVHNSLWTLQSPVLWNRGRLDTFRKQVQCHRCFLFTRMSPKWASEYEARRCIERKRDVCPRRCLCLWAHSLSEAGRKQGEEVRTGCNAGEVCARRLSFSGCTWKSTGGVHAVFMRGDDWEILGVQEGRLSWTAIYCVPFFFLSTLSDKRCWRWKNRKRREKKVEKAGMDPAAAAPSQPDRLDAYRW